MQTDDKLCPKPLKETFEWPKFHFQNVYDILKYLYNQQLSHTCIEKINPQ